MIAMLLKISTIIVITTIFMIWESTYQAKWSCDNWYDWDHWNDFHDWKDYDDLGVDHPPPVELRPDEDEGVHPYVQLPVGVGGVQ